MFKKLIIFVKYHNTVSILFTVIFLGAGGVFAANEDLRATAAEAIFSGERKVTSVDNSFIRAVNLDQFTPTAQITNVTEDDAQYYVSYVLNTIDLVDGRWDEVSHGRTMAIAKAALKNSDLGLYVAKQLKEIIDYQIAYLREVQEIEQGKGEAQKIVATTYSGLIGKFLDPKEETFPGYVPVILPEEKEGKENFSKDNPVVIDPAAVPPPTQTTQKGDAADKTPPTITILGNNPAVIEVRSSYSDNGVSISDNVDSNLGASITLNGSPVTEIQIDTATAGEHTIVYTATDSAGNSASATRIVRVEDSNATESEVVEESVAATSADSASSSQADSTISFDGAQNESPQTEESATTTDPTVATTPQE